MLNKKIIRKIDTCRLSKKLKENIEDKYIESEQWFNRPDLWYRLTAFSNPYITVYSELILLEKHNNLIEKLPSTLIFYGLGTGDTEIRMVNSIILKNKEINIIGIDVQEEFITGFIQSLDNICYEDNKYDINFVGIKGLFQELEKSDFDVFKGRKVHIVLGNTIGNFKCSEIFNIFSKTSNNEDILLIGFQTDTFIEKIFRQYKNNKMFNDFIKKSIDLKENKELIWKMNKKESQIEAWSDDVLVFHSKKTNPVKMVKTAEKYGFKNIEMLNDNNTAIQIYEKI